MITNRAKLKQASRQRPNAVTPPDRCATCHEVPAVCRCPSPAAGSAGGCAAAGRLRLDQHAADCDYPIRSCWCKTKDQVSV